MLHFCTKEECLKIDRQSIKATIAKIRKADRPFLRRQLAFHLANYKQHKHMKASEF